MHRASKQASTTLIFCRNPASSNSLRVSRIASAISGGSSRWLFRLFLVPAHDSFRLRRSSFVEVKLDAIDHVEIVVSSAASIPSSVASPAMPYCPIRVLETSGCQILSSGEEVFWCSLRELVPESRPPDQPHPGCLVRIPAECSTGQAIATTMVPKWSLWPGVWTAVERDRERWMRSIGSTCRRPRLGAFLRSRYRREAG